MGDMLEGIDRDDDAAWAAGVMLRFFLEGEVVVEEGLGHGEYGGVLVVGGEEEVMARL